MPPKPKHTVAELRAAVEKHGSMRAAARALKMDHTNIMARLGRRGVRVFRRQDAPEARATGQVHYRQPVVRELPAEVAPAKVYLLTAAQIGTEVHAEFWRNLRAYQKHRRAELIASGLTYDQRQYRGPHQVKTRSQAMKDGKADDGVWFADEVKPYLSDARIKLAPTLQFCGELNILPTVGRPLSKLEGYTGGDSSIVPHTKIALESVPTGKHEPTKFLYTTGACTLRNYIQKRAGQIAEFHHAYGVLIVEVLADGRWFARQINATSDGAFQDLTTVVRDGKVSHANVSAIQWGDIHASAMDQDVRELCWGRGGVLDALRPRLQFMHDLIDFHSASHHERKSARTRFERLVLGQNNVKGEVQKTREFLCEAAAQEWCETIVVPSNHDEHGDRWLDEGDPLADPENSLYWHAANTAFRQAFCDGDRGWSFARWALDGSGVRVLGRDEDFVLHDIQMAWHGDLGPNGARGSTRNLVKTCRRISKGHDHQATICDGVYSAGVCARTLDYARGPSAWSISHIVIYPNGKRAIITQSGDAYWAPRRRFKRAA